MFSRNQTQKVINSKLIKSACGINFDSWHFKEANGSSGGLITTWDNSVMVVEPLHYVWEVLSYNQVQIEGLESSSDHNEFL